MAKNLMYCLCPDILWETELAGGTRVYKISSQQSIHTAVLSFSAIIQIYSENQEE
jgi:hypothetical protein